MKVKSNIIYWRHFRIQRENMFVNVKYVLALGAILSQISHVISHGRLIHPPQRSSAWRYGFDVPPNYDDAGLFCGGTSVQWGRNGGKCGVCGDAYDAPIKENEDLNGKYVTGVITGTFIQGAIMEVQVEVTANHKGWFEFRLCALESPNTKVTQECLDKNPLKLAGEDTARIHLTNFNPTTFTYELQLPQDIVCEHCVLQWIYNTGNSWGCDKVECCTGCGPQENFWNCADIRIVGDNGHVPEATEQTTPNEIVPPKPIVPNPPVEPNPISWDRTTPTITSTTTTTQSYSDNEADGQECKTHWIPAGKVAMCHAVGIWQTVPGIDNWCCNNCYHFPSYCPPDYCDCHIIDRY